MKYAWIDAHRKEFEWVERCDALTVSASGSRSWKHGGSPDRKGLTDGQMLALIQAIDQEWKGAYGSPRMVRELRNRGFPASKERVERLMRENGIRARHKRRFKATTDFKHALRVAPNLLARDFMPAKPNQVWTADMTYIWTPPPVVERFDVVEQVGLRSGPRTVAGAMHPLILQTVKEAFRRRVVPAIALAAHRADHPVLFQPRLKGCLLYTSPSPRD